MKIEYTYFTQSLPNININLTIFGFDNEGLKVLILKFKNSDLFSLPAGTVLKEEDVDFSAHRVLKETTGLQNHYLQHFGTFGKSNRVNKDHIEKILKGFGVHKIEDHFMSQRFVAVSYLALVDIKKVQLSPDPFSDYLKWFPIDNIPSLIHDHNDILKDSLTYLKNNIDQTPIIQYLMPEAFTMKELQMLYERILNEKLVRTNFQRWILGKNILERLEKLYTGRAHKAPYQYRFKK